MEKLPKVEAAAAAGHRPDLDRLRPLLLREPRALTLEGGECPFCDRRDPHAHSFVDVLDEEVRADLAALIDIADRHARAVAVLEAYEAAGVDRPVSALLAVAAALRGDDPAAGGPVAHAAAPKVARPASPGWYWVRRYNATDDRWTLVHVYRSGRVPRRLGAAFIGSDEDWDLSAFPDTAEWQGPIAEPT